MLNLWQQMAASLLCLAGQASGPDTAPPPRSWAAYYDSALPAERFKHLDLVVFDRRHHPDFMPLKGKTTVLAYVSIGEVYDDVPEKTELTEEGALLAQHAHWKSHVVDATSPQWRHWVLGYVEDAVAQGFDGVMLDTADSPIAWAQAHAPERTEAMRAGIAELVQAIRAANPGLKIMINRGFGILPLVAQDIDYVLAESIYTNTNVSSGQFTLFPPSTYDQVAKQLHDVNTLAPGLRIFTLDYWKMDDVSGLETIYAAQRAQGFTPYVATPDLRLFAPEPAPGHCAS